MATSGKSPVSALQELMAAKKMSLPTYFEEDACGRFKSTVYAGGVTAIGFGTTKKAAKQESAKNVLEKLRELSQIVVAQGVQIPLKNYVGDLNEYASKKNISYPDYYLTPSTPGIEEYIYTCNFWGKKTYGRSQNKKDAKQYSAKNMLEMIAAENGNVNRPPVVQTKITVGNEDFEELRSVFDTFTLHSMAQQSPKSSGVKSAVTEIRIVEQIGVEMLSKKLREQGVDFTVTDIQSNPYVLCLKIKDSDYVVMEKGNIGDSRDETLKKLLENVLLLKGNGHLNKDLISL